MDPPESGSAAGACLASCAAASVGAQACDRASHTLLSPVMPLPFDDAEWCADSDVALATQSSFCSAVPPKPAGAAPACQDSSESVVCTKLHGRSLPACPSAVPSAEVTASPPLASEATQSSFCSVAMPEPASAAPSCQHFSESVACTRLRGSRFAELCGLSANLGQHVLACG